jgi:hypothetical protein
MYSAKGLQASPWRGCPIRTSPDQSLLAAPRGLSQPSTSFIGSWCQGIHRAPLLARRLDLSTSPSRQDQRSQKNLACLSVQPQLGRVPNGCISVCSTTLRFFRYTPSALASASRGVSTSVSDRVEPPRPALQLSVCYAMRLGTKMARRPSSRCGTHGKSSANAMRLATPACG